MGNQTQQTSPRRLILVAFYGSLILVNNLLNYVVNAKIMVGPVLSVEHGQLQYYYEENETSSESGELYSDSFCRNVILLNVGTAMSVTDYHKLGTHIAEEGADLGIVSVIIDTNPGSMMKQSGPRFSKLVNTIYETLDALIPVCDKNMFKFGEYFSRPTKFFIGGHSGGGEGAVLSLMDGDLLFDVAGFVGMAPYKIVQSKYNTRVPTLVWGFFAETCGVKPEYAALAAYEIAPPKHRVFYQVQNDKDSWGQGGPHCSFTDNGCLHIMCSGGSRYSYIPEAVGQSVTKFVRALNARSCTDDDHDEFEKVEFVLDGPYEDIRLFVNDDVIEKDHRPGALGLY